jgi:hypothetical protein
MFMGLEKTAEDGKNKILYYKLKIVLIMKYVFNYLEKKK